jgi:phage terminase large subunit-like protein
VHEVRGAPPWADPKRLDEQKRRLLPSVYARLFDNVWMAGEDKLTTIEDVKACVQHDGDLDWQPGSKYVCALDVGLVGDRTVAVIAHGERRPAGLTVAIDRVAVWQGRKDNPVSLDVVEAWVETACRDYRCHLIFDPYQAQHLAQRLRQRHVRVDEFTFTQASTGRLAVTLFRLLRDHLLDLPDDEALIDELVNVQLREVSPGSYRLDHASGRHDDMAVATAMAAQYLIERPASVGTGTSLAGVRIPRRVPVDVITTVYPWERDPWANVR